MWRRFYEKLISTKDLVQSGVGIIGTVAILAAALIPGLSESVVKFVLVGIFIAAVLVIVLVRRAPHMATPDEKSVYYVNLPCTPSDLDNAIEIAQGYFGRDSMKPDTVRAAYRANPFSFIVIKDDGGKVLGYFDHFGLEKSAFDQFIAGELPENQLGVEHFVSGQAIVDARRLYIGGIAIKAASKFETGKLTKCLLSAGCELLNKRYLSEDNEFELYATGFSKEGLSMLKSLGFGKVSEGDERKDGAPLYWRTATRKGVAQYRRDNPICKSELVVKFTRDPQAYTPVVSITRNVGRKRSSRPVKA